MDRQAEGPVSGSERVKLHHNGAIDFIAWLGFIGFLSEQLVRYLCQHYRRAFVE